MYKIIKWNVAKFYTNVLDVYKIATSLKNHIKPKSKNLTYRKNGRRYFFFWMQNATYNGICTIVYTITTTKYMKKLLYLYLTSFLPTEMLIDSGLIVTWCVILHLMHKFTEGRGKSARCFSFKKCIFAAAAAALASFHSLSSQRA